MVINTLEELDSLPDKTVIWMDDLQRPAMALAGEYPHEYRIEWVVAGTRNKILSAMIELPVVVLRIGK